MHKIKLTKGLQINKEQISKLQEEQMNSLKGGVTAEQIMNPYREAKYCAAKLPSGQWSWKERLQKMIL